MKTYLWNINKEKRKKTNLALYSNFIKKKYKVNSGNDFNKIWKWSVDNPKIFWKSIWDFTKVKGELGNILLQKSDVFFKNKFFTDTKLNYAENLLKKNNVEPAIIFKSENGYKTTLSWRDLNLNVLQISSWLKSNGIQKGDRVAAYLPNIPETVTAYISTSVLGAIWSSCSPDFGTAGVIDRFSQIGPKILFIGDKYFYNGKKINMIHETEISKIDWKKHKVDVVLECTGKFNTKEKSAQHIKSGAKKVLVSAPCKEAINIIFGVNEKTLKNSDQVISAASCTTNCLAPVAKVINDNFGIETGFMTTIHSYTADQKLLDNSHKDLRRARSAPNSIIPTTTGATKSLGDVIPELKDKVEGISIRVPTPNVSLVEFVFSSKKNLSVEEINNSLSKASKSELKNILDTSHEQLISTDFNHNSHSAIVDLSLTKVIEAKMAKVSAWYDNEWGFACRMCDLANYLGKI